MLSSLWARITKSSPDTKQFNTQQLEYMGKPADAFMVFPYGIHGNVPPDSIALLMHVQRGSDEKAAIAWSPKKRPKLAENEVAFYHPPTDAFIIWRQSGNLDIETGGEGTADINIKAQTINIEADMNVTGDTHFTGRVRANGKIIDDTHGHIQGPDSNGDTEDPISGVT